MKKLILSFLGIAAIAATTLTSCKKDSEEATPETSTPSISVITPSGSNGSVNIGGSIVVSIKFDAAADQKLVKITRTSDAAGSTAKSTILAELTSYTLLDTLASFTTAGLIKYTYTVEDKEGHSNSVTVNITVTAASTPMGSPVTGTFFHIQGSLQGAYDLVGETMKSSGDAAADKDMVNADPAGPFTGGWASANNTTYVQANSFDYVNATVEAAASAFAAGSASISVSAPAVGDIYIAKLRGGSDYAVIKVTALDASNNDCGCNNKGKITFNFKKKA